MPGGAEGGTMSEMGETGGVGMLLDRIRGMVAEQLGVDEADVQPEANILEDLGADSLDVVELVMALEEAFDIEVPDEDVEGLRTIGDVEKYIQQRVPAAS
jgi:acyl carrier protein